MPSAFIVDDRKLSIKVSVGCLGVNVGLVPFVVPYDEGKNVNSHTLNSFSQCVATIVAFCYIQKNRL